MALTDYQITFEAKGPVVTPLHSDTLFGHVCWALRYLNGREALRSFLKAFDAPGDYPFLISNGFPTGYLPKPAYPLLQGKAFENVLVNASQDAKPDITSCQKALRKKQYIPISLFEKLQADLSSENVTRLLIDEWVNEQSEPHGEHMLTTHNSINRVSNIVTDVFRQTEKFYRHSEFTVYVQTSCFSEHDLKQIFGYIQETGFGRDKSTGKGHFKITVNAKPLPGNANGNGFMVLSNYTPNKNDPTAGFYKLFTKYGRLGGDFAKTSIQEEDYPNRTKQGMMPFKKPILMMEPGAIFSGKPSYTHGILLGGNKVDALNVHDYSEIRHNGCAVTIGLQVNEKEMENAKI